MNEIVQKSNNIIELCENIQNAILLHAAYISGKKPDAELTDKEAFAKLTNEIAKEKDYQILQKAVKDDAKLSNLKSSYQNLAKCKQKPNQFNRQVIHTKQQIILDCKKKRLEIKKSRFWLGVTTVGLLTTGILLTAAALSMAHTPPVAIAALTISAAVIAVYVVVATYLFNQDADLANKVLEKEQDNLDKLAFEKKHPDGVFLNEKSNDERDKAPQVGGI